MSYVECDRIEPEELLFHDDFSDPDLTKNWEVTGGDWKCENGICTGIYRENGGGLIYTHKQFHGDIMLDFTALSFLLAITILIGLSVQKDGIMLSTMQTSVTLQVLTNGG